MHNYISLYYKLYISYCNVAIIPQKKINKKIKLINNILCNTSNSFNQIDINFLSDPTIIFTLFTMSNKPLR